MSAYHTPVEKPHGFPRNIFRRATTRPGHLALVLVGVSVGCFVAAIIFEGVGEGLYGTGDWPGVTGSALGLGWILAVAGVFGFGGAGVILAGYAIFRRSERAPCVFVPVLALPAVVLGGGIGAIVTMILTAAAVLTELIPHRSH